MATRKTTKDGETAKPKTTVKTIKKSTKSTKKEITNNNAEEDKKPRKKHDYPKKLASKIPDDELERIVLRVRDGENVAAIAKELDVGVQPLDRRVRARMRAYYAREWQTSAKMQLLRLENVYRVALSNMIADEEGRGAKWGSTVLGALQQITKILGLDMVDPTQQSARVAGMSRDEAIAEALKKL